MHPLIENHISTIIELCEKHHVEICYLIGSILTDKFNKASDIDFLVKFGKIDLLKYADNYFDFQEELAKLLNRQIDLVIEKDLQNKALIAELNRTKQKIYERKNSQMAA